MSKRSDGYRKSARECELIARLMSSNEGKREFEKLARGWNRMAEHADRDDKRGKTRAAAPSNPTRGRNSASGAEAE
jgi:hypothetical protein